MLATDGGTYECVIDHRDRRLWVHTRTGLRVEALRFGGPIERLETGREPDGLEHWSVSVRPPAKMGDAALLTLTDGDRYTEASALRKARTWMEAHPTGVPKTYTPETVADYHDDDAYRVATDGGEPICALCEDDSAVDRVPVANEASGELVFAELCTDWLDLLKRYTRGDDVEWATVFPDGTAEPSTDILTDGGTASHETPPAGERRAGERPDVPVEPVATTPHTRGGVDHV